MPSNYDQILQDVAERLRDADLRDGDTVDLRLRLNIEETNANDRANDRAVFTQEIIDANNTRTGRETVSERADQDTRSGVGADEDDNDAVDADMYVEGCTCSYCLRSQRDNPNVSILRDPLNPKRILTDGRAAKARRLP